MAGGRPAPIEWFAARPRLAALLLGLLSATGFRPLGLWPLALLAVGLFAPIAARTGSWKAAFGLGWLFGLTHFTLSNYWIASAFTFQSDMPAFLGWIAVPLVACYLALYPAIAVAAARLIGGDRPGWGFALVLSGAWIVTEWLRSWVFTGYAWNPFAMVLLGPFDRPGLAAIAPMMGTYALSGVALLLGCALVLLWRERHFPALAATSALLVAGMHWPAPMPASPPRGGPAREGSLHVTIAQPNIPQPQISNPAYYEANFSRLAQLSGRIGAGRIGAGRLGEGREPRLVLWPESGMADFLEEGYPQRFYDRATAFGNPLYARRRLGTTVGANSVLLTGAVDLEIGTDASGRQRALGARNAVTVVSEHGEILGSYDKAHLVPGGEYLPLRDVLEPLGLSRLVAGSIDFWSGPGPRTLDLGEYGKVGMQICYEIAFSGQVVDRASRPDFIFNPSSEAWFGAFAAPQFLAQSRMRAIEEGLPVLRATNSGISAVIDTRGVVREYLDKHAQARIDTLVPPAAAPTLFARAGNILALGWALVLLVIGLVAMRKTRR